MVDEYLDSGWQLLSQSVNTWIQTTVVIMVESA